MEVARRGAAVAPELAAIWHALASLRSFQPLNQRTHATHAAALADLTGELVSIREDVGRHNAMDKLLGGLLGEGFDAR